MGQTMATANLALKEFGKKKKKKNGLFISTQDLLGKRLTGWETLNLSLAKV